MQLVQPGQIDIYQVSHLPGQTVQPGQIDIYQTTTYKKDLSWLHFNNQSRIQEEQQVKDQQSYVSLSVYLTYPSSS